MRRGKQSTNLIRCKIQMRVPLELPSGEVICCDPARDVLVDLDVQIQVLVHGRIAARARRKHVSPQKYYQARQPSEILPSTSALRNTIKHVSPQKYYQELSPRKYCQELRMRQPYNQELRMREPSEIPSRVAYGAGIAVHRLERQIPRLPENENPYQSPSQTRVTTAPCALNRETHLYCSLSK
jgi:hypothetical protein